MLLADFALHTQAAFRAETAAFHCWAAALAARTGGAPAWLSLLSYAGATAEAAKKSANTPIVIATKRNKDEKPVSMAALILEVPDMDKAIAAVVAAGGKGGTANKSGEGLTYAMVADPEGNPIELWEPPAE